MECCVFNPVLRKPLRDTSSNGTSSSATLRRKFLSNYQFVEKKLRRMHFHRIRHLIEFFEQFIAGQAPKSQSCKIKSLNARINRIAQDYENRLLFSNDM